MKEETNPYLHYIVHEVVENQIREEEPEETKKTLNRLMEEGCTRHEAVHKIGTVVMGQVYEILKHEKKFDKEKFIKELRKLE